MSLLEAAVDARALTPIAALTIAVVAAWRILETVITHLLDRRRAAETPPAATSAELHEGIERVLAWGRDAAKARELEMASLNRLHDRLGGLEDAVRRIEIEQARKGSQP